MKKAMIVKRYKAQRLYVKQFHTAADTARKTGVTPKTIGKWIKLFGWQKLRDEALTKADNTMLPNPEIIAIDLLGYIKEKAPHLAKKVEPIINEYLTLI